MQDIEKIKPAELHALIAAQDYFNPPDTTLTICILTLTNDFTVTGESACLNPADFNVEIGKTIAFENAFNKLWSLEGYKRKSVGTAPSNAADEVMIAHVCHEVNRAYCASIGDTSQPSWEDAPEWQAASAVSGVRFHLAADRDPSESHENWLRDKVADGWSYGPIKDPAKKQHPCMVPYNALPPEQRAKDKLFKAVVDSFKQGADLIRWEKGGA